MLPAPPVTVTAWRSGVALLPVLAVLLACAERTQPAPPPSFLASERCASLAVDGDSGCVLAQTNTDRTLHPASLIKVMTLDMTFGVLERGDIALKQVLPVSARAAARTPTELGMDQTNFANA